MKLITIIIPVVLLISCSQPEAITKASAESPTATAVKTQTNAGAKLSVTNETKAEIKDKADSLTTTKGLQTDYTGYYLPWPKFPIHPSAVKSRSTATPNLHYGVFHIRNVDYKTKTILFSNLAFGKRTEYTASFNMEGSLTNPDGTKIPLLTAQMKPIAFHVGEKRIMYRAPGKMMKRMDKLKPFKYNPAAPLELKFPTDRDVMKFSTDVLPNASTKVLKAKDLKELELNDLKIMRMSIYARHGAAFQEYEIALLFSHNNWYAPFFTLDEVQKKLTTLELKNIDLLFSTAQKKQK